MQHKKIFLFGTGIYGTHLYHQLHSAGEHVMLISHRKHTPAPDFPKDTRVHQIDFCEKDILSLGIDPRYDQIYCAFDDIADTLFILLSLRALFPQASITALSDSEENNRKLRYTGADQVIDLYASAASHLVHRLTKPAVSRAIDEILYRKHDLKIVEVEIPAESHYNGTYISQIDFKSRGLILLAIVDKNRQSKLLVTDKGINQKLKDGDILILIGRADDLERFEAQLWKAAESHATAS